MRSCPEPIELERFAAGALGAEAATTVGGHVETCEECSRWLEGARRDDNLLADLRSALRAEETIADEVWREGRMLAGYRIVRELGRGGMGVVYEAEQQSPRRSVALKVMQPSVASARRLEREAEALGRLQHPGIAQIFEAGTFTGPSGPQPFFAMELVRGRRLDRHVADADPSREERLDLLIRIADAVHHAHQKGVIHRDLKPSNILVDDSGQPKVLDFGVARLSMDGDEPVTMQTQNRLVGTIPFMSPEQAAGAVGEIDTRSDVYGLGVVAFQIMSGRLPHDLSDTTVTAALRIVAEEEAPLLGAIDPSLRGDLETIVAKALSKDKDRRYASASDLARDLERHVRDEPIAARPPSTGYLLRKFAKRHRVLVGAAAAVFLALVGGIVATSVETRRAQRAERDARLAEKQATTAAKLAEERRQQAMIEKIQALAARDFLQEVLVLASPDEQRGKEPTIREVLDVALQRVDSIELPVVEAAVRHTLGRVLTGLGRHDDATRELERSLQLFEQVHGQEHKKVAHVLTTLARSQIERADFDAAERSVRRALSMRGLLDPEYDLILATALNGLGIARYAKGSLAAAVKLFEAAIEEYGKMQDRNAREVNTALALGNLAMTLGNMGQRDRAETVYGEAVARQQASLGAENPQVARTLNNFARFLMGQRRYAEAEPLLRRALAIRRARFDADSVEVALTERTLGETLFQLGKRRAGLELARAAVAKQRRKQGKHPMVVGGLISLAKMVQVAGSADEAIELAREAVAMATETASTRHPLAFEARLELGRLLLSMRRASAAEPILARAYRFYCGRPELGRLGRALVTYAQCLLELGQADAAVAILEPAAEGTASRSVLELLADAYARQGEHARSAEVRGRIK